MDDPAQRPAPPDVPGYTWRPARPDDGPTVRALQAVCAAAYDNPPDTLTDYAPMLGEHAGPPEGYSLCAVDTTGGLVALGWVRVDPEDRGVGELRVGLFGDVHPVHRRRGLGAAILRWTGARGRDLVAARREERPAVLRIDFSDRRDDAIPLYERLGFRLRFHEYWLRRDLTEPVPDHPLPAGLRSVRYAPAQAGALVAAFNGAFRTRWPADYPGLGMEEWRGEYEDDPDFRPELTLLTMNGEECAGFVIGQVWEAPTPPQLRAGAVGWIPQLGVVPAWRGRGVAAALLAEVLRGFRDAGYAHAALTVNRDIPAALRLYDRLGFVRMADRVMYRTDI
jgi:GNAT superfamily N-acetyltransferase